MNSEKWQVTNKDSPTGGGKREGVLSSETWHVTNKDSPTRGEEEGETSGKRSFATDKFKS